MINDNLNEKKVDTSTSKTEKTPAEKLAEIKKKQKKAELDRFKSKYFEYYDDIKISDRQDW